MLRTLAGGLAFGLASCGTGSASPGTASSTPAQPPSGSGAAVATPTPSLPVFSAAQDVPGRLLFVADANIWQLERGAVRRLTPDRISRQPAWSRDRRKIVHVKLATSGSDLWTMDADGSNSIELTDNEFQDDPKQHFALRPQWWPDGSRLLYLSDDGSMDPQLWQLTVADRRRQRFIGSSGDGRGGVDCPKLSPDGGTLLVSSFRPGTGPDGRSQVWSYTLANGVWRQLTTTADGAYDPDWSPDGKRIAYTVRAGARHDVWVMNDDGSSPSQVTAIGAARAPAWSPDGQWLAFLSAQSGLFELWAGRASAEAPSSGTPPASRAGPFRAITRDVPLDPTSGLAWA